MSKTPRATPQEKELYWMHRITTVANRTFPDVIRALNSMVDMANHGLSVESRKKLRVLIANDLGRPLMRLEIPHDPLPEKPLSQEKTDSDPTTPVVSPPGDEEHLRSGVLPDAGSADGSRSVNSGSNKQGGS